MNTYIALSLSAVLCALAAGGQAEEYKVDEEGFIRNWLILAPIANAEESAGAAEIDKEQVAGQANLKPKAGETVKVGGKELTWKKFKTADYYIDFNTFVGNADDTKAEDVTGYAVAYVVAGEEMKGLNLKVCSNDQAKIWLNGKEVYKYAEGGTIEKDRDTVENVTLQKGENVIVFKVANEKNNWQGCARFTDKSGAGVKSLKVLIPSK